tara:strand:+ start:365 stop:550 length:186 start_codon:yes stop_codon:yes gene_type:complete
MESPMNPYEQSLYLFGIRCEVLIAMERGGKIGPEEAYQEIKKELKILKKVRKQETFNEPSI